MKSTRWQYTHDDGRTFYAYASDSDVAAAHIAWFLQVPAALVRRAIWRAPQLARATPRPFVAMPRRTA